MHQLLLYRHHQEKTGRQSSVPPWVLVSFLAMPDGLGGVYPAPSNTSNFRSLQYPIDLKPSDFSEWIASPECTDSLAEALEMAKSRVREYVEKQLDLEKALKERGAKKEHHEEEQVAQEGESPESPKKGVGQNIRSIIQQIEQGMIDGIQLNRKNITLGEAKALAEAMVTNAKKSTIKTLEVGGNEFRDEGVMAFSKVIADENCAVEKLDLGGCGMRDRGAFALAEALKKNKTVRSLDMGLNTGITARGIGAIAEALGTNSCITSLRVNDIVDRDGASHLAQALETNTALKNIDLNCNKMMGTGATEIARALKKNRSLEVINLTSCDINDDTVFDIALALQENKETALMIIDLGFNNNITDAGAERLVQALNESNNQTIRKINLYSCSVSSCSDKRVRV